MLLDLIVGGTLMINLRLILILFLMLVFSTIAKAEDVTLELKGLKLAPVEEMRTETTEIYKPSYHLKQREWVINRRYFRGWVADLDPREVVHGG